MSVDNQKKHQSELINQHNSNQSQNFSSLSSVSSISPKNATPNNLKSIQLNLQKNFTTNGSFTSSASSSTSTNSSTYVKDKSGQKHQHQHHLLANGVLSLNNFDMQKMPAHIKFELDQLELELLEGDITQKGYDKKRARILETYVKTLATSSDLNEINRNNINHQSSSYAKGSNENTKTKEKIRIYRKKHKDETNPNRFHSGKRLFFLIIKIICELKKAHTDFLTYWNKKEFYRQSCGN